MNVAEHAAPPLRVRDANSPGRASSDLSELVQYRHLIWYMATSSLAVESRGTKLGRSWWIVEPILLTGVYTVLIHILGRGVPHFALLVLAALLAFQFFSRSVSRSMSMLQLAQTSLLHVGFPRSVIPLAVTISETIRFVVSVVAFIAIAAAVGIPPTLGTVIAVPFMITEIVFTLGASYFFAATGVFFRDMLKITEYLFFILFQVGCGMFPLALVSAHVRTIVLFNPFTTFFEGLRAPLLYGAAPDIPVAVVGGVVILSILVLVGGYRYFLRREGSFSKVVL